MIRNLLPLRLFFSMNVLDAATVPAIVAPVEKVVAAAAP
jgi:hypothetical protein